MKRIATYSLLTFSLLAPAAYAKAALPTSHLIPTIAQQTQRNGISCGAGALESVLEYRGPAVDQKAIADVARTSSYGTYSFDIVRTGQFSALSSAQGDYYAHEIPTAGFPGRPLGLAAFGHNAATPWLAEAKAIIARDIPVIMLMNFTPEPGSGAHYRVLVGYNDALSEAYFVDPWGRDMGKNFNADGTVTWTYAELASGWNYAGYGSDLPNWGAAIYPWTVAVSTRGKIQANSTITVNATVTYPCLAPFNCAQFPATQATAQITLPTGMHLASGGSTVALPNLASGQTASASWSVVIDSVLTGTALTVTGSGLIAGSVPVAQGTGNGDAYPAYAYADRIGGTASLAF